MSYATIADFKLRYDIRRIGDLVNDDETRATSAELDSSTTLQACLDDAHSMIDSACLLGKRYTADDLSGLTGTDAALLKRICCDLAYGLLVRRRGFTEGEVSKLAPGYGEAVAILRQLRLGELVFVVDTVLEAGTAEIGVVMGRDITLVTKATRLFGNLDIQGKL